MRSFDDLLEIPAFMVFAAIAGGVGLWAFLFLVFSLGEILK